MFKSKIIIFVFAVILGSSSVWDQGKKILVVDDSSTVSQQVKTALSQAGFVSVEAADSQQKAENNYDDAVANLRKIKAAKKYAAGFLLLKKTALRGY